MNDSVGYFLWNDLKSASIIIDYRLHFLPPPFLLSAILLAQSIKGLKEAVAKAEAEGPDDSDYKRVLSSLILSLVYVFVLQPVGFIISTFVYLFGQIFVLAPDEKRTKKDIILYLIIDVVFVLVVFFLFRYGFKIVLPAGIFTINL